jgi:Na+/melibiose symporter-like transporter
LATKIFYGLGQYAEGVKGAAFSLALLFYYTQVLGLSGFLVGLAIFIAQAFDAVTDPVAGFVSDNFKSRFGRRHPFMYASAIPLAVSFYFVFAPPAGLSETELFLWLLAFTVATRASMTLYHVPHLALGAELTTDYVDRTAIAGYRTLFSYLGVAMSVVATFLLFFVPTAEYKDGQMNPAAYPAFAHFGAALMVLAIWLSAYFTRKEVPYLPQAPAEPQPFSFKKIFQDMREALRNYSFRSLFIGAVATIIGQGIGFTLLLHLGTYFWELGPDEMIYIFVGVFTGNLLGVPCVKYLNRWIDKKPTLLLGAVFPPIFAMAPILLRLIGVLPENGEPMLLPIIVIFAILQMFANCQALVTTGSLIADIADEHELTTGRRQEGIFFGAQAFINKALYGLGVTIAGIGLDLIHFPAKAEPGTVAQATVNHLGILYGLIPAATGAIAFLFYYRIRITRESHAKTLEKLEALKAAPHGRPGSGP